MSLNMILRPQFPTKFTHITLQRLHQKFVFILVWTSLAEAKKWRSCWRPQIWRSNLDEVKAGCRRRVLKVNLVLGGTSWPRNIFWFAKKLQNCKIAKLEIVWGEKFRRVRSLIILQIMIIEDSNIESLYLENIFECTEWGYFCFVLYCSYWFYSISEVFSILYFVFCILYFVFCILYFVFCILYFKLS